MCNLNVSKPQQQYPPNALSISNEPSFLTAKGITFAAAEGSWYAKPCLCWNHQKFAFLSEYQASCAKCYNFVSSCLIYCMTKVTLLPLFWFQWHFWSYKNVKNDLMTSSWRHTVKKYFFAQIKSISIKSFICVSLKSFWPFKLEKWRKTYIWTFYRKSEFLHR